MILNKMVMTAANNVVFGDDPTMTDWSIVFGDGPTMMYWNAEGRIPIVKAKSNPNHPSAMYMIKDSHLC